MRSTSVLVSLFGLFFGGCASKPAPKASAPEPEPNYQVWREAHGHVGLDNENRAAILGVSGRVVEISAGSLDGIMLGQIAYARIECGVSIVTSHVLHVTHLAPRHSTALVTFWMTPPRTSGVQDARYVSFGPVEDGRPTEADEEIARPNLPVSPGVDWSVWGVDEAFTFVGQLAEMSFGRGKFFFLVNLEIADVPLKGTRLAAPEMTGDNDRSVVVVRRYYVDDDKTKPVEQLGCSIDVADLKYEPAKGMRFVLPK